jgi:type II secretory pathway component GspD/PulD (secretin)
MHICIRSRFLVPALALASLGVAALRAQEVQPTPPDAAVTPAGLPPGPATAPYANGSDSFIEYQPGDTSASATVGANNLISITVDNVPLVDVVRMFTKLSDANIIATTSNLEGTVTVSLADVEWRPALSSILEMHGLALVEKTPGSGIWSIVPRSPDAAEPLHVKTIRLRFAKVKDIAPIVQNMMTGTAGTVSEFPSRNTIIIRATTDQIAQISTFIDEIDVERDQVYIEAKFIELNRSAADNIGIDWQMLRGYQIGIAGMSRTYTDTRQTATAQDRTLSTTDSRSRVDTISEGFDIGGVPLEDSETTFIESPPDSGNFVQQTKIVPTRTIVDTASVGQEAREDVSKLVTRTLDDVRTAVLTPADVRIILSALKERNGVAIISNPKIIVANEEKAEIHIGESEPNIRGTVTPGQQGQANTTTFELDPQKPYFQFGIQLDVTPTVNTESNITVEIVPKLTRFIRDKTAPDGNTFPITSEKSIRTEFNLESGKTAAIGGLTETSDREIRKSIPLLGDIPLIGKYLFSHSSTEKQQQETIIFVTVGLANPLTMHRDVGLPENVRDTQKQLLRDRAEQRAFARELEAMADALDAETMREASMTEGESPADARAPTRRRSSLKR